MPFHQFGEMLRWKGALILVSGNVAFGTEVIEYSKPVGITSETAGNLHHVVARWGMGGVHNDDMGHPLTNLFDEFPWERSGNTQSRRSAGAYTVIPKREPLFEICLDRPDNSLLSVMIIPQYHDVPTSAPSEPFQKFEKSRGFVSSATDFCEMLFAQMGFICGNRRQFFKLVE